MRLRWIPELDADLRRLRDAGWTRSRIADHFGVHIETIARRARKLHIAFSRDDVIHWPPEWDQALRQYRALGWSWAAIARKIGVDYRTARRRAAALGIPTMHLSRGSISGVRMRERYPLNAAS